MTPRTDAGPALRRAPRSRVSNCRALALLAMVFAGAADGALGAAQAGAPAAPRASEDEGGYLVLLDAARADEFRPAAERLARLHGASVVVCDLAEPDSISDACSALAPAYVAIVAAPERLDLDVCHAVLERLCALDDDPFPDAAFGFITGRDGAAADAFVGSIEGARGRTFGRRGAFLASWEGAEIPERLATGTFAALGWSVRAVVIPVTPDLALPSRAALDALDAASGSDLLVMQSHGTPETFAGGFRARDVRGSEPDLDGLVVFNCACFNGVTGRSFQPDFSTAPVTVRAESVAPDASLALAFLERGVAAYVAGMDAWHGPLMHQVLLAAVDDGLPLGDAMNAVFARLALDVAPARIEFGASLAHADRFAGEGVLNRRMNAAGGVLFGDPAFAPFAATARHSYRITRDESAGEERIVLALDPQTAGPPGIDASLVQSRLIDYFSIRSPDVARDARLALYRVLVLDTTPPAALRVVEGRSGKLRLPLVPPRIAVEDTPRGPRLHVLVEIDAPAYASPWLQWISAAGARVEFKTLR